MSGNKIVYEDNVKLLGVTIDYNLNFDNHISEMCKKASRQLNILKRIGKYMNRLGRLTFYYSFILSNFNYCPVIWHYCSKKNGFLFRSEFFFRTTQELEYLFFLSRKARNFFPEFNIRLYDKNSESDYFFFLHQNQNIFFSNIGNQNIFFRKKP